MEAHHARPSSTGSTAASALRLSQSHRASPLPSDPLHESVLPQHRDAWGRTPTRHLATSTCAVRQCSVPGTVACMARRGPLCSHCPSQSRSSLHAPGALKFCLIAQQRQELGDLSTPPRAPRMG